MRRLLTSCLLLALLFTAIPVPAVAQDDGHWITHVVQSEENLFRIALQYNLGVETLMQANGLSDPDLVRVGQQLLIPLNGSGTPRAPVTTTVIGSSVMHTIAAGDTLTRIAARYDVTLSALLTANNLTGDTPIVTGQVLVIPIQSADLGLIGVGPITIPTQSNASAANDLDQPDLGLIGVSDVPAPAAEPVAAAESAEPAEVVEVVAPVEPVETADAVDPVDSAPVAADPDPTPARVPSGGASDAPADPDPTPAHVPSGGASDAAIVAQGDACTTCDTEHALFKDAMSAAAVAVASAVPAPDMDAPDTDAPDTDAAPERVASTTDGASDLGILPVEDTSDTDSAASDVAITDPAIVANDPALQSDLGILAPEAAQLLDSGVITLNNDRLRRIYLYGLTQGNDPHAFSTIGDCNSEIPFFMAKFDRGEYDLGPYHNLQPVIEHFAGSFDRDSAAVWTGNHVWALFDATWSNPALCMAGETPLECEFRIQKPSFALIRLGTNEAGSTQLFEENMRRVITYALAQGTIPILGTKADQLEGSDAMNELIRDLAEEYAIPLWDFGKAAAQVPARGLLADGFHLSYFPPDYSSPLALQTGHGMQNLTALLALDTVWREVTR